MVRISNMGLLNVSWTAAEDLSDYQYHFMESAGAGSQGAVKNADSGSATYSPIGVLQNDPESGEEATVVLFGPTKIVSTASVSVGEWLTCNGSGHADVTTEASLACGWALSQADSSASCIIEMFFAPTMCWLTKYIA